MISIGTQIGESTRAMNMTTGNQRGNVTIASGIPMHMALMSSPPSGSAAIAKATPQAGADAMRARTSSSPAWRFEVAVGGSMLTNEFGVLSGVAGGGGERNPGFMTGVRLARKGAEIAQDGPAHLSSAGGLARDD